MHNLVTLIQNSTIPLLLHNPISTAIFLLALAVFAIVEARSAPWVHLSRHEAEQRNKFINGSLASSISSRRMFLWSESVKRARLQGIRFHSDWQHPDCTVMRWYNDQSASSRKFQTIEHRRDIRGPFYHESLSPRPTDGAVCRLERAGEGLQADAIRYTGCAAHDLIQWFGPKDHAKFESEHPSALISEVGFPFEYDIIDALAVCYSVQNTKACRVYTLQRYNCYFLCLTVLAVLTRRAASLETIITGRVWNSALG
ncbi:hypothetical protein FRC08_006304 [Ceratobasidium sp. 394]|nr:hypothetical protein FRC08_006304 [Ceratobasidium sp. 394]